jgi:hypothetical protein
MYKEGLGYRCSTPAVSWFLLLVCFLTVSCDTRPRTASTSTRVPSPPIVPELAADVANVWVVERRQSAQTLYAVHDFDTGFVPILGATNYGDLTGLCEAVRHGTFGSAPRMRATFPGAVEVDGPYRIRQLSASERAALVASGARFVP